MAYAKTKVLTLYRSLLRNSYKFDHYNFREYFLRQTRSEFRKHRQVPDNEALVEDALKNLAVLKRQATINKMYHFDKLVVEKLDKHHLE
ncbi:hypothetical protein PICMEDRAFT_32291 [Pichia membranifaciens NRRL Y-2026]|uniref:Complex 1 LYR protein domain-containing protein n=1 Tax=Pichia membranifaciens NRRL Y-2026 TaxID=763406 RepID=A0A1E3NNT2_9ASCO|nr:hypothetical protein PICMEDRAFT_32291 [Pichia membranifaciens NRRL Y-2026]ODQ47760.1 hypothetical protein PICMEDRAFT_32291 [Pichia membranifaciens NRRL Y-2026]